MDRFGRRLGRLFWRGRHEDRRSAALRRAVAVVSAAMALTSAAFAVQPLTTIRAAPSADARADDAARQAAMIAIDRETEIAPLDATPWLELAWRESQSPRGLGPEGNTALLRSYALAPYGPEATLWRQAFIFDHWRVVTPEVRARALDELAVVYPRQGWDIEALASTIADPTGRMVVMMASRRLRAAERLRRPLQGNDAQGAVDGVPPPLV